MIRPLTRFRRDESGSTLVEFAIVAPIFLFLVFALIDYGRLGFSYVMAQKATERAVRMAVVRTPACAGVPTQNTRALTAALTTPYGSACTGGICRAFATQSCSGDNGNATASEIFDAVSVWLPVNATAANLTFTYEYDARLGFLGGPYTPVVTVRIDDVDFDFVTPLGRLAALMGTDPDGRIGQSFAFPSMSVSLPAERLLSGETT